ncbi:MAG: hypothetical protein ACREOO_10310 [bacterium]
MLVDDATIATDVERQLILLLNDHDGFIVKRMRHAHFVKHVGIPFGQVGDYGVAGENMLDYLTVNIERTLQLIHAQGLEPSRFACRLDRIPVDSSEFILERHEHKTKFFIPARHGFRPMVNSPDTR